MSDWTNVAHTSELAEGEHRIVDVDDVMVAVFNVGGEFVAFEDICPHDGSEVASGCVKNGILECPRHSATFDLRNDGEVLSPPAYEGLAKLPLRIQDEMIQVRDDRWD